jgi:hypothetical protein
MSPPVLARIQFTNPERGSMDVENALDAFDVEASVEDIEATLREALGVLRNCDHPNAGAVADKLLSLLLP